MIWLGFMSQEPRPIPTISRAPEAKKAGLYVYVAMAPTYPECDEADLRATLVAIAGLDPLTIFHEPINVRAENVKRIEMQAQGVGVRLATEVFATREGWQDYAVQALGTVLRLAKELGIEKHVHLWPDKSLGCRALAGRMPNPEKYSNGSNAGGNG